MIFNAVSIVGYALVLLVPSLAAVIAGMFLFLSWTCFSLPATFSRIGAALETNRHSMGVGVQMVIKRLPIMIAPIFGGILIDRFGVIEGVRIGLVISIFLSAITILVQRQLREELKDRTQSAVAVGPKPERWKFWQTLRGLSSPMRRLLLSDILIRFCERIPYAWVVIFAMDYIGLSASRWASSRQSKCSLPPCASFHPRITQTDIGASLSSSSLLSCSRYFQSAC